MTTQDTWAVVLVKPFALAKQRLAPALDPRERSQLARVMLEDVMGALDGCTRLTGVIVVTADEQAAAVARRRGGVVFREPGVRGVNAAIVPVVDRLTGPQDAGMIVVPADLPHVSAADVDEMIDAIGGVPAVALVRASRDGGTNMLGCRPAGAIAPAFGPDSFVKHCLAASRQRIRPRVWLTSHLGLDLDRPEDLEAFLDLQSGTRTHAYLTALDVRERLGRRIPPSRSAGPLAIREGVR